MAKHNSFWIASCPRLYNMYGAKSRSGGREVVRIRVGEKEGERVKE